MTDKPTIVLVHGAFADASGFGPIITTLDRAGYPVVAPPNPLRSLLGDAESFVTRVAAIDGPVVLVGHSYGGAVIGQAAAGLDNVIGLVYLAAFGLDVGESLLTSQNGFPPSLLATENAPSSYDAPGAPGGPDLYIKEDTFHEVFCADLPEETSRVMWATQRPLSAFAFTEAATAAGWMTTPSWFLVSSRDNAIPPTAEQHFAERMGATTETIDASHCAFIAHPDVVGDFILRATADFVSAP